MTAQRSLTEAKADLVRAAVIGGISAVLEAGRPLTFKEVAGAAGVPERTVYRHFPTRKALLAAALEWTNEQIGHEGARPTHEAALLALVRRAFQGFDRHAAVVRQLLIEPDGLAVRTSDVASRRHAAVELVDNEIPGLDRTTARRVAAAVQVLTLAATWQSLHDYWDHDGEEAADTAVLAIQLVLEAARARQQPTPSTTKRAKR